MNSTDYEIYDIDYEQAKNSSIFKILKSKDFDKIMDIYDSQRIKSIYVKDFNKVMAALEFGTIAIQLNAVSKNTHLELDYLIRCKCDFGAYSSYVSYGYAECDSDLDTNNLEADMFQTLMNFAEENNLYWNRLNMLSSKMFEKKYLVNKR